MKSKMFEIRDYGTTITAIAIKTDPDNVNEFNHFRRGGWGNESIILIKTNGEAHCEYDAFNWNNRTMLTAHQYIEEHYDELENFEVIDVQYILGETDEKKVSEII